MKKNLIYIVVILTACQGATSVKNTDNNSVKTDSVNVSSSSNFPALIGISPQVFIINPTADTLLKIGKKGTQIHIPKDAFVDEQGKIVTTPVSLDFKEYTNPAEMAFSDIPMVIKEKNGTAFFNSSGMFEINGKSNGKQVEINPKKSLKMDYFLVKKNPGIAFYKLDKVTKTWTEIQKIKSINIPKKEDTTMNKYPPIEYSLMDPRKHDFELSWLNAKGKPISLIDKMLESYTPPKELVKYLRANLDFYISIEFSIDTLTGKLINVKENPDNPIKKFDPQLISILKNLPKCNFVKKQDVHVSFDENSYELMVHLPAKELAFLKARKEAIKDSIEAEKEAIKEAEKAAKAIANRNTILGLGQDTIPSYPDVVKSLDISSFGVYNCDQLIRLHNPIDIIAHYVDPTGKKIEINDSTRLSLIDFNLNGAFNFNPNNFTCSASGKNCLVLFTQSSQVFLLGLNDFNKMKITTGGEYTFTMKNITNKIKDPADLAAYF